MVYWMEIEMKCSLLTIDSFSMLHSQHYCRIVFVTDISNGHEEKKKKLCCCVNVFVFHCNPTMYNIIIEFFSIHNIFYPGSSYVYASTFCRVPANQNQ